MNTRRSPPKFFLQALIPKDPIITAMFKASLLLLLIPLLTSCGGLTYYVHRDAPAQAGSTLAPVILQTGETVKTLKHTTGFMWGGYKEGLAIEDPGIVGIHYGKTGSDGSDNWADLLSIKGLKPGRTRAVYCNRLGERPDFRKPLPQDFLSRSFDIHVR